MLWQSHSESIRGIGRVSTLRIDITSPASGLISRMPHNTRLQWSLFDHVREGDVIAEYDSSDELAGKQQFEYDRPPSIESWSLGRNFTLET